MEHGTLSAYNHHRCRCPACRKANAERSAAYKKNKRERMPKKVKAYEYECDGCHRSFLIPEDGDKPLGFHGAMIMHHHTGGHGGNFFVCIDCGDKTFNEIIDYIDLKDRMGDG